MPLRIATFNVENLDAGVKPPIQQRIKIMKPQLLRLRADVLCLQEVHSQGDSGSRVLSALDELIDDTDFAGFHRVATQTTSGELYDNRNLVILSRFPFMTDVKIIRDNSTIRPSYQVATADPPDAEADTLEWERPMLYVVIELPNGKKLRLINVHLKSKIPTSIKGQKINNFVWKSVSAWAEGSFISSMKRLGQALQARMTLDEIFDTEGEDEMVAICGDFNATADEVPVKAICGPVEETGNPAHASRVMVPCENNIPESRRFSLYHLGRGEMLDHIIVSRALLQYFQHAEIHNEALPDESGAFRTDTKFPESDHAPVIAEFMMP